MKTYKEKMKWGLIGLAIAMMMAIPAHVDAGGRVEIRGKKYSTLPTSTAADGSTIFFSLDAQGRGYSQIQPSMVLEGCQATTGWTVLNNDTDNLTTSLNHISGVASLSFDKVDGAGNSTVFGIQKTITSIDLTPLQSAGITIFFGFYLPSVTNFETLWIRVGTDSTNYNEWQVDVDSLAVGWNAVAAHVHAPTTYAGNGWNASAVTYIAAGGIMTLESNAQAGFLLDRVAASAGLNTNSTINSEVSTSISSPNFNLLKVANKTVATGIGGIATGLQRVVATDSIDASPAATNVLATTAVSAQYTLPSNPGRYLLQAVGASVYVAADTNPTATVGGDGFFVPLGVTLGPVTISEDKLAGITAGGAGYLYVIEMD